MKIKKIYTTEQAIDAINSRIHGIYDNKQLLRLGPLFPSEQKDILRIITLTHVAPVKSYKILDVCGVKPNYKDWNDFRNTFNSMSYSPKRNAPKKLIASVIREFEQFCKDYHIDASKYPFIEPCEIEGVWRQFDFSDSTDKYPSKISIHSIISNKNGKIFQRVIDI